MSMKLMVRVLEEADVTRPQQAILLAMAENANDDGSNCRPSVDLIAWKAGYKPRNVVDIIRELRNMGVLEVVREATQRRATEYHIHLDKAPRKQSFDDWQAANGRHAGSVRRGAISRVPKIAQGCNLASPEVQSHVTGVQSHVKAARENAPEPVSEPVKEPDEPEAALRVIAGGAQPKPAVVGNKPEHHFVNAYYRAVGGAPTNHGKDIGHAVTLLRAGVYVTDLPSLIEWAGESWYGRDGFDLGTFVQHLGKWRTWKAERSRKANARGGLVFG